jgi:ABC-2 type transport system ATP-binding protein
VWAAIDQLRTEGTTVLLVTHELDEAEQLCDRVIAMRAGRILDSGTPGELVDRHGPSATISFTTPVGPARMGLVKQLAALPGVRGVEQRSGKVVIVGGRESIAHVGAALVQGGWIPPDLCVRVPSLEDALVGLLDSADRAGHNEWAETKLIGAMR